MSAEAHLCSPEMDLDAFNGTLPVTKKISFADARLAAGTGHFAGPTAERTIWASVVIEGDAIDAAALRCGDI